MAARIINAITWGKPANILRDYYYVRHRRHFVIDVQVASLLFPLFFFFFSQLGFIHTGCTIENVVLT